MKIDSKKYKSGLALTFLLLLITLNISAQQLTSLNGILKEKSSDTLFIFLTQNSIVRTSSKHEIHLINGNFKLQWDLNQPAQLFIRKGRSSFSGIIEPGENISLAIDSFQVQGPAAAKFEIATSLQSFKTNLYANKSALLKAKIASAKNTKQPFDYLFHFADSAMFFHLSALQNQQHLISQQAYALLKADILGTFMLLKYNIPTYVYNETPQQTILKRQAELSSKALHTIKKRLDFDESLVLSDRYMENIYTILFKEYQSTMMGNNNHKLVDKYKFINASLPTTFKLPVLSLFIESDLNHLNQGEDLEQIIAETIAGKENSIYSKYITSRVSELFKKGSAAPQFSLNDNQGKMVKLSDFLGKVVLLDFWFKDCMPCHALFEKLKPVKAHFNNPNEVVFLNISIDSRSTWLKALKQFDIKGIHLYTEGLAAKHPIITAYKVAGYPTTALIDKQGKIFIATPSDLPNELISQISAALKSN